MTTVKAQQFINSLNTYQFSKATGSSTNLEFSHLKGSNTYVAHDKETGTNYFCNQQTRKLGPKNLQGDGQWKIHSIDKQNNSEKIFVDLNSINDSLYTLEKLGDTWNMAKDVVKSYDQIGSFNLHKPDENGNCGTFTQNGVQMNIQYNSDNNNYEIRGKDENELVYTCHLDGNKVIMQDAITNKVNTVEIEEKTDGTFNLTDTDGIGFEHQSLSMVC